MLQSTRRASRFTGQPRRTLVSLWFFLGGCDYTSEDRDHNTRNFHGLCRLWSVYLSGAPLDAPNHVHEAEKRVERYSRVSWNLTYVKSIVPRRLLSRPVVAIRTLSDLIRKDRARSYCGTVAGTTFNSASPIAKLSLGRCTVGRNQCSQQHGISDTGQS